MTRRAELPVPKDRRNPGEEFLAREIDDNRRAEFWLIPKTFLSLAIVAALIVLREVFKL
ncbi:hypothetical protein [Glaciihabitans sp. GrIS 2.15]|jgi:hypothetical protein|uniref:hypothetical protein n=1 Tax=Glaciihabitans sp. GrIS 2.15 TaxID=3071710 RepID=UPI0019A8BDC8|nr:hypothetical protein [Microbacteriaceae bacterium]MEC5170152.1 hypothetical protein [Glaciihabitans sp. GrIS 2.15]